MNWKKPNMKKYSILFYLITLLNGKWLFKFYPYLESIPVWLVRPLIKKTKNQTNVGLNFIVSIFQPVADCLYRIFRAPSIIPTIYKILVIFLFFKKKYHQSYIFKSYLLGATCKHNLKILSLHDIMSYTSH